MLLCACSLVHVLLDEIVGSTVHRCLDPVTMEPSVSFYLCFSMYCLQIFRNCRWIGVICFHCSSFVFRCP